jgi:molybdenum cofactor cytidylyltransferase
MSDASLQVIVLAAGDAKRFGSPKQLARINGVPMLRLTLGRALSLAGAQVTVVLGAHASSIAPAIGRLAVNVVVNRNWEEGLSASIRAGIASLPGSAGGVLLLLADQVGVTSYDLQRLADAWRRNSQAIVAAQYGGGYGVPALFPRSQFARLAALRGEQGARQLLRSGGPRIVGVPMPGGAQDIDTPEDLASFMAAAEAEARERETGETWRGLKLELPEGEAAGTLELED